MVLDVDRHVLFCGIVRRPLRDGPAEKHTVELQAEVVVQPAGPVLLDDEGQGFGLRGSAWSLSTGSGVTLKLRLLL